MDRDFSSKVKKRKLRRLAIFAVLAAACAALALSIAGRRGGSGRKAEVTIAIRCDDLAKHPERLTDPSVAEVIPADGAILAETKWEIEAGTTTVFDVTDAVCRKHDIQIEYNYTPGYDSHYIKGIGYIYEFSAGKYSGWVFTVDGESPNYGADQITLHGGEKIVWEYTTDY